MNAIGLRKILKKFDKRFGYKFTDYYVSSRANHPYSQLQEVFKHVGIGALVGALSRNFAELQDGTGSYLSIYDHPYAPLQVNALDNLPRLFRATCTYYAEEIPRPIDDIVNDQRYHLMSLLLNLANTFLYMVNTYIIVPTADNYSLSLGAAATVCGVVIGSMAVAQIFSLVYFSAWSNKSYFRPLVFSSIVLLMGNILYALAYDLDSLAVLPICHLLCGEANYEADALATFAAHNAETMHWDTAIDQENLLQHGWRLWLPKYSSVWNVTPPPFLGGWINHDIRNDCTIRMISR
ncbi:hypothetical protein IFM89_030085 [Coptis chinensis]|uniref:SPX domain-containing protein n=1 Tax=Coptis chinensis TaxID=261450 RepID=A0A835H7Z0_9MAGN|nr:hypothetical protein IFM89_030085 [Coptis chinensis]